MPSTVSNNLMVLSNMVSYRIYLLGGGGAACITLGAILVYTWSTLVRNIMYQQLLLKEDSDSFKLWRDTPVPQHMSFYFYNWLNPEGIEYEKPKFSQMGPYRFSVEEKKTDITWNNNGTITFKIKRFWHFDAENSNGTLDDEIVTLNSVALSAARTVRYKDTFLKKGLSSTMWTTNQKISVRHTIGDILFFGYSDTLLDIGRSLPAFAGVDIPPYDKFAWFYNRNGSDKFDGVFNMDTGINDIFSFGLLKNWNYNNKTSFYPSTCAFINGSAGELYPPARTKTNVQMFSADLCRSVSLSYSKEEEIYGITGYKYVGDKYTFDNGSLDPSNECFCDGECSPRGVLNVTRCRYGAPGFISFPHFYSADTYFLDQVEGLKPTPEKHTLYITLEPTTGIPLDVAARFQINLLLSPVEDIGLFENVPSIYFPILWLEQRAVITEELAARLRLVTRLPLIGQCFSALFLIIGTIMILCAVYIRLSTLKKDRPPEEMIMSGETETPLINGSGKEKSMIHENIAT